MISAEAARQLALDLRRPVTATHGTARAAAGKHQAAHVSGKTGTSNDGRDAWFAGFTADFTGVIAAQATGKKGTQSGGGYPAASFGGIVDSYWTEKNWRLANDSEPALGPVWRWTEARLHTLVPEAGRLIAMILLAALLLKSRRRVRETVPALPGAEPFNGSRLPTAPVAVPAASLVETADDRPLAGSEHEGAAARAVARPLAGSEAFRAYFGVAPADALRPGADE